MFAEKVFSDTCGDFSISPWDIKWAQMEGKGGSELCKKQKEENYENNTMYWLYKCSFKTGHFAIPHPILEHHP